MHTQKITVETKGQLLAAFHCAICTENYGAEVHTHITLLRRSGVTKFKLRFVPCANDQWAKWLRKSMTRIRQIPAKELLA